MTPKTRRRSQSRQSGQSLVESAVTLALISVVVVAVAKGIASRSTSRLAEARDVLDVGRPGETFPPVSVSSTNGN